MSRDYPTWVLIVIIIFLILLLLFIVACAARHTAFPLSGGSISSGEIAVKTLRWHKRNKNKYDVVAVFIDDGNTSLEARFEKYLDVLPDHIPIYVYHTARKTDDIRYSILSKYIDEGRVKLLSLGVEKLTPLGYSKLICSTNFWHSIPSEKVLFCQSNVEFKDKLNIDEFVKYDYDFVGKPCTKNRNSGWHALFTVKGWSVNTVFLEGDLSLRSKSKCIQVLEQYPWDEKTPENIWFSAFLPKVGGKIGKVDIS